MAKTCQSCGEMAVERQPTDNPTLFDLLPDYPLLEVYHSRQGSGMVEILCAACTSDYRRGGSHIKFRRYVY